MPVDVGEPLKISVRSSQSGNWRHRILLEPVTWDDWFKYQTLYNAFYFDGQGIAREIGSVKVAVQGMAPDRQHPLKVGENYSAPPEGIYSVGQSEEYSRICWNLHHRCVAVIPALWAISSLTQSGSSDIPMPTS